MAVDREFMYLLYIVWPAPAWADGRTEGRTGGWTEGRAGGRGVLNENTTILTDFL